MEKKERIYVIAESEEETVIVREFKKKCIDLSLSQKEAVMKILKEYVTKQPGISN